MYVLTTYLSNDRDSTDVIEIGR